FLKEEVKVSASWNSYGMKATSSNSFSVDELAIPKERSFIIGTNHVKVDHPLYYFPFQQFAEATLAVNFSGLAQKFLELSVRIFSERSNLPEYKALGSKIETTFIKIEEEFWSIRRNFYTLIEESWSKCEIDKAISLPLLERVSQISKELALTSRRLTEELYPYCGMTAANKDSEINRVWRNIHTASQHIMML
ncbi:MAG: acyl-CoA dehydrogenase, partial [Bacteroidota bacterium]|nr:acyl-CoA dehydrogenase [Bacteroidota bacterium]